MSGSEGGKAQCTVLTNSHEVQAWLDEVAPNAPPGKWDQDKRGKTTRISLRRFTSYYTLVQSAAGTANAGL